MPQFRLLIADRVVSASVLFESTCDYCGDYLTKDHMDFSITITPEDIAREREIAVREHEAEAAAVPAFTDAQLELTAIQRKIAEEFFRRNVLVFHGSAVAVDGEVYLFTAKSGTGKSTHTRLWREVLGDRAVMLNDDKPFLEMREDAVIAHGSPWMGKHRLGCNMSLPLKAICILERGEQNRIEAISAREALPMLFQQSQSPARPENLPKYLELLDLLARNTAFYRLRCNMEPEAAEIAYRAMSGKNDI